MTNCDVCNKQCEGNIHVINKKINRPLDVCGDCLNDFGNQDYDSLNKKLEKRDDVVPKASTSEQ